MSEIKLTKENFAAEAVASKVPVLVDFWAPWCMPCRMIAPFVEELAEELDGQVKVCKVNIDEEEELAVRFSVRSIPTLILLKNGEEAARTVGAHGKDELKAFALK